LVLHSFGHQITYIGEMKQPITNI